MRTPPQSQSSPVSGWQIGLVSGLLFLPFLLGYLLPDGWWATHFTAFLPSRSGIFCLVLSATLFSLPFWDKRNVMAGLIESAPIKVSSPVVKAVIAGVVFGIICYAFPLYFDFFGDAPTILPAFEDPSPDTNHWKYFLSLNVFHPRSGERTVLNLVALMMEMLNCEVQTAFSLLGAFAGACYAFFVSLTVSRHINHPAPRLIALLSFLAAPSALIFMGHVEIYAPLWPVLALSGYLCLEYFKKNEVKYLLWNLPVIFLALKFHPSSLLLALLGGLLFVFHALRKKEGFKKRLNWKWMRLLVILPLFVAAMVVYFGVLGDHRDPRFLGEGVSSYERLFLPLLSPDAPLDRYNLLSPGHLWDYLNLILLWSPLGVGIMITARLLRKQIDWNKPEILALGLVLLMYMGLFFLVNPLLGMPFDWDLMAIPAPLFGFFALVLIAETQSNPIWRKLTGPALGILILILPMLYVHTRPAALSLRLESMGRHTFRTYWIRSAGDIEAGLSLIKDDPELYTERFKKNIDLLKPDANRFFDLEFAVLAAKLGQHFRKNKDLVNAQSYHYLAYTYYQELDFNLIGLIECAYFDKNFERALPYCQTLIRLKYPSEQKALAIGVELALRASDVAGAHYWVRQYRKSWPDDPAFRELDEGLQQRRNLNELIAIFGG